MRAGCLVAVIGVGALLAQLTVPGLPGAGFERDSPASLSSVAFAISTALGVLISYA